MAAVWAANDKRNKAAAKKAAAKPPHNPLYPDGTPKTYYPGKPWLNEYGYSNDKTERCPECGQWECDYEGVGHYRG